MGGGDSRHVALRVACVRESAARAAGCDSWADAAGGPRLPWEDTPPQEEGAGQARPTPRDQPRALAPFFTHI